MTKKIYTKVGDEGETFVMSCGMMSKASPVVAALGMLDELNSWCGLLYEEFHIDDMDRIQADLLNIGAEINCKELRVQPRHIEWLENRIDEMTEQLLPLTQFILPRHPAKIHIARAVCRRTEQSLADGQVRSQLPEGTHIPAYINRLSDYLFTLARYQWRNTYRAKTWDGKVTE